MTLTDIISIFLATIGIIIAFIESKKTRKLTHNAIMFLAQSETFRKIYYGLIILLIPIGLFYSFILGVIKILEGNLILGTLGFLIMACALINFAFASYKIAQ